MPNHLINETSPYLLQHAHNPVEWYPWGEEAFEKSRREDKPILVSIGYATCHWCHVMEQESFEDEETAKLMNAFFINIKIDREERPDLDHLYMDALQALTGSGGWPLNVFLTPDKKPFYGGTYFPPQPYYNRPSWKDVLIRIHQHYSGKKKEVFQQANSLTDYIKNANSFSSSDKNSIPFNKKVAVLITENILKTADKKWGGFSPAPKFPQTFSVINLLREYHFQKNEEALQQATLTLDKIICGGIYDHIGGGISRYSTDEYWLAPHFEKMLYDNALLIEALAEACQLTQKENYKNAIEETIIFAERELKRPEGGFYCALDADSEGVEGKFYTWDKAKIDAVLAEDNELFCKVYNITREGNWEHTNILWLPQNIEKIAAETPLSLNEFSSILEEGKRKLWEERAKRERPATDDKILSGQNALMISALCKAYAAVGTAHYLTLAKDTMTFLEENLFDPEEYAWKHTFKNREAKINAFLDDLACITKAYIDLHECTGNNGYIIKAKNVTEFIIDNFSDEENVLFYFTEKNSQDLVVRKKEIYDGATPSGNAVMASNLQHLSIAFDIPQWNKRAIQMLQTTVNAMIKYPTSFGIWCSVLQKYIYGINEIAIVGENAESLATQVLQQYIPNKLLFSASENNELFPILKEKEAGAESKIYLCRQYTCKAPVTTISALMKQISATDNA